MNFNPLMGRQYHSPGEDEFAEPDPSLTIVTVILCIIAPFWLVYKLVDYVVTRVGLLTGRAPRLIK